ncbi:uncharacterized protein HRG_08415 [Hirsutella rhossiliensis]|uniref:Uncharacterized protein n=1 Tax=Hirsutella rhossiliensis TaxID=111463 RepID=A0A9P8SGA4_9HYPO|nr:uncharacterized protein HRG_08415 [Hirsutella rhossiliensis]KAH0960260.1 hypothetical protein HRG_08415 [Hirsutella rhossiliensis]
MHAHESLTLRTPIFTCDYLGKTGRLFDAILPFPVSWSPRSLRQLLLVRPLGGLGPSPDQDEYWRKDLHNTAAGELNNASREFLRLVKGRGGASKDLRVRTWSGKTMLRRASGFELALNSTRRSCRDAAALTHSWWPGTGLPLFYQSFGGPDKGWRTSVGKEAASRILQAPSTTGTAQTLGPAEMTFGEHHWQPEMAMTLHTTIATLVATDLGRQAGNPRVNGEAPVESADKIRSSEPSFTGRLTVILDLPPRHQAHVHLPRERGREAWPGPDEIWAELGPRLEKEAADCTAKMQDDEEVLDRVERVKRGVARRKKAQLDAEFVDNPGSDSRHGEDEEEAAEDGEKGGEEVAGPDRQTTWIDGNRQATRVGSPRRRVGVNKMGTDTQLALPPQPGGDAKVLVLASPSNVLKGLDSWTLDTGRSVNSRKTAVAENEEAERDYMMKKDAHVRTLLSTLRWARWHLATSPLLDTPRIQATVVTAPKHMVDVADTPGRETRLGCQLNTSQQDPAEANHNLCCLARPRNDMMLSPLECWNRAFNLIIHARQRVIIADADAIMEMLETRVRVVWEGESLPSADGRRHRLMDHADAVPGGTGFNVGPLFFSSTGEDEMGVLLIDSDLAPDACLEFPGTATHPSGNVYTAGAVQTPDESRWARVAGTMPSTLSPTASSAAERRSSSGPEVERLRATSRRKAVAEKVRDMAGRSTVLGQAVDAVHVWAESGAD